MSEEKHITKHADLSTREPFPASRASHPYRLFMIYLARATETTAKSHICILPVSTMNASQRPQNICLEIQLNLSLRVNVDTHAAVHLLPDWLVESVDRPVTCTQICSLWLSSIF